MSNEKHTQGRLADDLAEHDAPYQDIRLMIGGRTICVVYIDDAPVHDYNAEQIANARRLVACWNACEGISTELLENAALMPSHIDARERLSEFTKQIEAQRDELLAALEAVQMDAVGVGGGENAISDATRAKVDAAIAKVKGGAA